MTGQYEAEAPSYAMTCKRCGGAFLEMVDLLFHRCGVSAQRPAQPGQKAPKVRLNGRRRETA